MTLEAMEYFEYKGRHLRMSAKISILNTFRYDAYWVFSWYFFWKQEKAKIFQNVPYNLPNTNFRHFRNISFHWFNEPTLTRQILKLKIQESPCSFSIWNWKYNVFPKLLCLSKCWTIWKTASLVTSISAAASKVQNAIMPF